LHDRSSKQHLSDIAAQPGIVGLINLTHAAITKLRVAVPSKRIGAPEIKKTAPY
jgi:hypothetical protein